MKNIASLLIIFFALSVTNAVGQSLEAYRLYTAKGKKTKYKKLIKACAEADIVFFGELHNNPISHWMNLALLKDLHGTNDIILGLEMFERDVQSVLNEQAEGKIETNVFDEKSRAWPNYKTDYLPMVSYCQENEISVIATNIPRKYASQVFKQGLPSLETLPAEEKEWIAPLPIAYDSTLSAYAAMLEMEMAGHNSQNFPKAQAVKDATMAHSILEYWKPNTLFLHANGKYHSDDYQGIVWYVQQQNPDVKIITISTVEQKNIDTLSEEYLDKAHFILAVPEDMTKTY